MPLGEKNPGGKKSEKIVRIIKIGFIAKEVL